MEDSADDLPATLAADYITTYISLSARAEHRIAVHLSIDKTQRRELIRWIAELCNVYRLSIDTLATTIHLVDRYASVRRPSVSRLQLLAGACLFVASKYHERYHPALSELVFLCDGLYTTDDFLAMQDDLLNAVQYRVTGNEARLVARLKVFGRSISPDFCEAIDFVARAGLLSPDLTFASTGRLADAVLDTIVDAGGSCTDSAEHALKCELLEALEESADVFGAGR
jgi:hypothetical protein